METENIVVTFFLSAPNEQVNVHFPKPWTENSMIEHVHRVVEPLALPVTYGAATTAAVLWGLHISDAGVIVSVFIAAAGFAVNVWATLRRERREQERHRLVMETLRNGKRDETA
jgi:small neutral amino acid transporter SnatA (MarC family)